MVSNGIDIEKGIIFELSEHSRREQSAEPTSRETEYIKAVLSHGPVPVQEDRLRFHVPILIRYFERRIGKAPGWS